MIKNSDCCFLTSAKKSYRLALEITQYCPYSCEYCFTWSSPKREKFETNIDLLISRLKQLIDELDIEDMLLTGGEPLSVIKEISPLLEYLNSKSISFSISSTLYDANLFKFLCNFKPRAINLSVDPPLLLDANSKFKSNYDDISKKIAMVAESHIPLKLTAVISRENIKGTSLLLNYLSSQVSKNDIISKIAFKREYQIGHAASLKPLKKNELNSTYNLINKWSQNIPIPVSFVNWSEFNMPLKSCPAGESLICVMQNGDVTPCSLLYNTSRSFCIGSLFNTEPTELKRRLKAFNNDLLEYNKKTEQNTPACNECIEIDNCGAGCLASMAITSNRLLQRTCKESPKRIYDPQRKLLKTLHNEFHKVYSPDKKIFISPKNQLSLDIEKKIRDHVYKNLKQTDLAHTIEHIDCVAYLSRIISDEEKAATRITVPAAYFHDFSPREPAMHHMHTFKSAWAAREFLADLKEFSENEILHIQYSIYSSSYGSHLLGYEPLSLEAKIVRDADFLDAIGARGIARVFAFNQAHGAKKFGIPFADPNDYLSVMDMNIIGPDETPILHFYTKLLKIYSLLLTNTGKKIGEKRHAFMIEFIKQYKEEIDPIYELVRKKELDIT